MDTLLEQRTEKSFSQNIGFQIYKKISLEIACLNFGCKTEQVQNRTGAFTEKYRRRYELYLKGRIETCSNVMFFCAGVFLITLG